MKSAKAYNRTRLDQFGPVGYWHEMPKFQIIVFEIFNVWGIKFMGLLPSSNGYLYILLTVDYVLKLVEVTPSRNNDSKVVVGFLYSNIFNWFGILKALISDFGMHFCNKVVEALLRKYGVIHKTSTAYYP